MPRSSKQHRETAEVAAAAGRLVRAVGRRVAAGDVEDLAELVALRSLVDQQLDAAVVALVTATDQHGRQYASYTDVGRVLGISRQAARQRFPRNGE